MRNKVYPFYFVLGALTLYLLFFALPTIMGFYYALWGRKRRMERWVNIASPRGIDSR